MKFDSMLAQASREWSILASKRPELTDAIALQRRLIERSIELSKTIDKHPPLQFKLSPAEIVARLNKGHPILSNAEITLDVTHLRSFVLAFCDDLAEGGAGKPAQRVRDMLKRGDLEIGSLLTASLMRRLHDIRTTANHLGVSPDLLWLISELSVAPIAHRLQRAHLIDAANTNTMIQASLNAWNQGRCPACASWPALAEIVGKMRHLRCSFCGATWKPEKYCCIYCDETGDLFLTAALSDIEKEKRRLELCRTCGGYLKSLDVDHTTPFELLAVIDLASSDLDAGAVNRGYTRPPMREFHAT